MSDDFSNLNLWDTEVEYNPDAELTQSNLPPDNVKPVVSWKLGQRGISEPKTATNGQKFFMVSLQGNVVAPGEYYDNLAIFDDPTSIVFEGGMGKLQKWLKAVGAPVAARTSLGVIRQAVLDALNNGAQCRVRGQWQGSVVDGQTEAGKNKYKVVIKGMGKFPQRADGRHQTTIVVNGEEVTAQYKVMDYLPLGGA
jgi:hypothetical protein